jgi:hypothetical protein
MAKNPPKEKGNSGPCFKCGATMFCREKEYNGMVSLQWQAQDGTSHYDREGDCKINQMPKSVAQTVTETKVNWVSISDDEKSDDMKQLVLGLESMRSLAYEDAKKTHPDMSENSNVFGQIVNAGISHLIELAKVKAIKESS